MFVDLGNGKPGKKCTVTSTIHIHIKHCICFNILTGFSDWLSMLSIESNF